MFVIEVPCFNLDEIYRSNQSCRWIKLKDGKYVIPFRNKALKVEQQKERFIMSCSEEDFYNIWFDYFDLKTDYMELNNQIKRLGGKFKVIANRGKGIHVLKQDIFETYIYAKIACKFGSLNAELAIDHIAKVCGIKHVQSMREAGRVTWYEFPTPEMILDKFDKLDQMGNVNKWLKKLCEAIVNEGFIPTESDNGLFELFALHDVTVFPVEGIEKVLEKNFDCSVDEFADWYLSDIESKGLVYLYILHHVLNPPVKMKEVTSRGFGR